MKARSSADKMLLKEAVKQKEVEGVKHWSQTPAGREYMSRVMKRRRKRGDPTINNRRPRKAAASTEAPASVPTVNAETFSSNLEFQVAYIFGRVESQLEVYANLSGIPFPELAQRLSELLRGKANGKVVRPHDRLPRVR